MNRWVSERLGKGDREAGFTLVELLMAIVILGIIAVPLSGILITSLKTTGATTARMSESHDAQMATSYFAKDVQATGVRDYTSNPSSLDAPLVQSVETGAAATGGLYPCGTAATPTAVVRLAWDDFTTGAGSASTRMVVAYVVQGSQLHRLVCKGSSTPATDQVLARDLVSPFATLQCTNAAAAAVACTGSGSAVPSALSLTLTIRDQDSPSGATYTVTLTGQRRQS